MKNYQKLEDGVFIVIVQLQQNWIGAEPQGA